MNTLDPKTRFFISTYEADFPWLRFLLASIEKYASGFSGITIICDNDKSQIPEDTLNIIKSIPLDVIYIDPPVTKPPAMVTRIGYMWQQVIKLGWWKYCCEDVCVQVDSDCIFKQPFTPDTFKNSQGKWIWHYRPWESMNNNRWKPSTEQLLGISNLKNQGMLGRYFVFTRECTKKLVECISNKPAEQWGWNFCMDNNIEQFSEYCLYGAFIENILHQHNYSLKVWPSCKEFHDYSAPLSAKYWSYNGVTPEIKREYESYLK